jgi:hypothetical protein
MYGGNIAGYPQPGESLPEFELAQKGGYPLFLFSEVGFTF